MTETKQSTPAYKCIYGNKVKLQNMKTKVVADYALVTPNKERLDKKHISQYTEIGKAIWGKVAGQIVTVINPDQKKEEYKILKVEKN